MNAASCRCPLLLHSPPTHTHTGESPWRQSILVGKEGNSRTEQAKVQAELPLHHGQHVNQRRSKQAKQSNGVKAEARGTWSLGQGWSYMQLWREAEGVQLKPKHWADWGSRAGSLAESGADLQKVTLRLLRVEKKVGLQVVIARSQLSVVQSYRQ